MKDVVRCDKLRGAANRLRSVDFRMGEPTFDNWNFEAGRLRVAFVYSETVFRLRNSSYQMKVSDPEYIGIKKQTR